MENAATSPAKQRNANVETSPEYTETDYSQPLTVKRPSYGQLPDATQPQAAVKVFAYIGTPSDKIGKDGDFYLEEETNVLYGPKINGTWPEDGVQVSGPVIRRKRREAQQAWSMNLPKESLTTRIRVLLLVIWKALRKSSPIALNLRASAPASRKRRPIG